MDRSKSTRRWSWPWVLRTEAAAPDQRFGFAVVGLGHGALKFLEAVHSSPNVRVSALVSGDADKAERLARRFHVPSTCTYAAMDSLRDHPAVQAVYLCLPNALHREFTERAALAGKHVLCEKPMAATVSDGEAMIQACGRANRLLMIGYRSPFSTVHQRMHEVLRSGVLGRVQSIRAGFGFHAKPGWRLEPALAGGGSLFDVGIYPVHTLHSLSAAGFTIDEATLSQDRKTGLEMAASWQGTLPSGGTISCHSSYLEKIDDFFEVEAEQGTLLLKPAFGYGGLRLQVRARHASDRRKLSLCIGTPRGEPSAFRLEAEHLAHCALTGAALLAPGESGLRDLRTLQQIVHMASA